MMRLLYTGILYILTPFIVVRLWWKGRRLPAYRARVSERFANLPFEGPVDLWLHAVSLGEVIAATPLIDAFLEKGWRILVTTTTPTGSERLMKQFGTRVLHCYLPYDLPIIIRRFFNVARPKIGVLMETELWPNLIYCAHDAHIPLVLANARLSDSSVHNYQKIKGLIKPLLNCFTNILTQSELDTERFLSLGALKDKVHMLGNIKFDAPLHIPNSEKYKNIRADLGTNRVFVIAASTHEGEEVLLLNAWERLKQRMPEALLLIAPRHPERFKDVYHLASNIGFKTVSVSEQDTLLQETEVVILDTLGELMGYYQISDYAFVGGSLVPVGGHNVLEPIALNVPVFIGPYVHNFKTICDMFQSVSAITSIQNADALMDAILALHQASAQKASMLKAANDMYLKNKGAVLRTLEAITYASEVKD